MKLSTKGRYAVMAMVDLARHAQAKPVSLSDIADPAGNLACHIWSSSLPACAAPAW